MSDETAVKRLIAEGRAKFEQSAGAIEDFFITNARARGALRLVTIGLAGGDRRDANWASLQKDLSNLFSFNKDAAPGFNANTIRRFGLDLVEQRKTNLHAYIALLACHKLALAPYLGERRAVNEGLQLVNFVQIIERYLSSKNTLELSIERNSSSDLTGVFTGVRRALGVNKTDIRAICRRFFLRVQESEDLVFRDRSYYACYRTSVSGPQIIKSFLVINSPGQSNTDTFTYTHIYKTKNLRGGVIKRITRGALIGFGDAFYLFGASARSINSTMDKAEGLKIVALPKSSFASDQKLLGGVFLSTSLEWQPIVGRIALVHLGFMSTLGSDMSDNDIHLGSLKSKAKLVSDIKSSFGDQIESEDELKSLSDFVLQHISNKPHQDRSSGFPEIFRSLATVGTGAHEAG